MGISYEDTKVPLLSVCLHVPEQAIQQKGRFSLGPRSILLYIYFHCCLANVIKLIKLLRVRGKLT